jgi:hypothetical protein
MLCGVIVDAEPPGGVKLTSDAPVNPDPLICTDVLPLFTSTLFGFTEVRDAGHWAMLNRFDAVPVVWTKRGVAVAVVFVAKKGAKVAGVTVAAVLGCGRLLSKLAGSDAGG